MKSYTSLEQSQKLADILPMESADFSWTNFSPKGQNYADKWQPINETPKEVEETVLSAFYTMGDKWKIIPSWSLAALLNYIKDKCGYFELVYLSSTFDGRANRLEDVHRLSTDVYDVYKKEAVDACYEMVLKLHEQKIL